MKRSFGYENKFWWRGSHVVQVGTQYESIPSWNWLKYKILEQYSITWDTMVEEMLTLYQKRTIKEYWRDFIIVTTNPPGLKEKNQASVKMFERVICDRWWAWRGRPKNSLARKVEECRGGDNGGKKRVPTTQEVNNPWIGPVAMDSVKLIQIPTQYSSVHSQSKGNQRTNSCHLRSSETTSSTIKYGYLRVYALNAMKNSTLTIYVLN